MRLLRCGAAFALGLALVAGSRSARAQCGGQRSTCSLCHDGTRAPYRPDARPHPEHAFADLCVACHGGRGDATVAETAHEGVHADVAAEVCAGCHPGAPASVKGVTSAPAPRTSPPAPHGRTGPNLVLGAIATALAAGGAALGLSRRREQERAA